MPQFRDDTPFRNGTANLLDLPSIEGRSPSEGDTISSKELEELTGATYRQIDYWCTQGYISPVGEDNPGSGKKRYFNRDVVKKVKLVLKISNAFSRSNSPLGYIFNHYDDGEFDMGDGVYLTWDVIEIEREIEE